MRRSSGWLRGCTAIGPTRPTCMSRRSAGCRRSRPRSPVSRSARRPPEARARIARDSRALHPSGRDASTTRWPAATPSWSRRPRRARRSATTRRSCMRSCRIRRAARCICFRPRRWRRISSPSCRRCARRSAGAVRRADRRVHLRRRHAAGRAAHAFAPARTSCSAIPTWCTRASCRTIRAGRSCSRTSRYVVIDELHAYRGVFGSHLCNVLRRLRRICRHYGSNPVFLCSSATIANPRELAERLTEQPFELVDQSGAPRGEKFFVFVNPPVVNHQLGIRRSYLSETRRIAAEFLKRNLQLIVFAQSRLVDRDPDDLPEGRLRGRARARRSGFAAIAAATCRIAGARSRRDCARAACGRSCRPTRSSSASTSARSTSAVMAGYPGTIAATWQRAGRAGRRASRSAAVMVASSAPLDQFIVRNPSYFFDALAGARADRSRTTCTSSSIT